MSKLVPRIKICGIASIADGVAAAEAGADAVGFIAVGASKRYVTPEQYRAIVEALPPFVTPVVVAETLAEAASYNPVCVQYYDGPDREQSDMRTIRAFRIRGSGDLGQIHEHEANVDAVMFDAYHPGTLGGAGVSFDWKYFMQAAEFISKPMILSGGLTPETVTKAIEITRPYAVDVSSGVESSPGIKDHARIAAFVRAVRAAAIGRT